MDTICLTSAKRAVWMDMFPEKMSRPGLGEEAFFAQCQKAGKGVGLDADGNLVYAQGHRDR